MLADDGSARQLLRYAATDLGAVIDRPGRPPAAPAPPSAGPPAAAGDPRTIGPGLRAVLRMWVSVDTPAIPSGLRHRLFVETTSATGAKLAGTLDSLRTEVRRQGIPTLDPPFHPGGRWLAGNGPSNTSVHRRTLLALHGRARISQRFAIDWVKYGDDSMLYRGDPAKNESWYGYGEEIVAAADGVVTEAKDGIPDNTPLSRPAVPITVETVAGNHVMIEHERGRYALYAHLQPGSVRVKLGDRVRRGQVLGLLGNSGNSDAPHIHFHLCDANSPLGSEGLPYLMERFEVLGRMEMPEDLGKMAPWTPDPARKAEMRTKEIPLENLVVRFAPVPARP